MVKKTTGSRARRATTRRQQQPAGDYQNPNTPVAPETPDSAGHVPFAERDEVTVNPNTPVAPETPDDPNAIPFADRDPRDPTGGAATAAGQLDEEEE